MDSVSPQPRTTRIRSNHGELSVDNSANATTHLGASPRVGSATSKSAGASWPPSAGSPPPPPPINTFSLLALFALALLGLGLLFRSMPSVSEEERLLLVFPRSLHDVRGLAQVLGKYRDENLAVVMGGFAAIYILSGNENDTNAVLAAATCSVVISHANRISSLALALAAACCVCVL